jgi:hypothetical protein
MYWRKRLQHHVLLVIFASDWNSFHRVRSPADSKNTASIKAESVQKYPKIRLPFSLGFKNKNELLQRLDINRGHRLSKRWKIHDNARAVNQKFMRTTEKAA